MQSKKTTYRFDRAIASPVRMRIGHASTDVGVVIGFIARGIRDE
jgi:hypothetical protein